MGDDLAALMVKNQIMSAEQNRTAALKMVDAVSKGFIDDDLVTDDVIWWIPGAGLFNREQFSVVMNSFDALRASMGTMTVVGTTAEGDRVAIEGEAEIPLKNGTLYKNTYHFLFQFRGKKICMVKEYNDSASANQALGNSVFKS